MSATNFLGKNITPAAHYTELSKTHRQVLLHMPAWPSLRSIGHKCKHQAQGAAHACCRPACQNTNLGHHSSAAAASSNVHTLEPLTKPEPKTPKLDIALVEGRPPISCMPAAPKVSRGRRDLLYNTPWLPLEAHKLMTGPFWRRASQERCRCRGYSQGPRLSGLERPRSDLPGARRW